MLGVVWERENVCVKFRNGREVFQNVACFEKIPQCLKHVPPRLIPSQTVALQLYFLMRTVVRPISGLLEVEFYL